MKNHELPDITKIGPGSRVRAEVAKLIGYINTFSNSDDATAVKAFFTAAATATTGRPAPAPEPDPVPEG